MTDQSNNWVFTLNNPNGKHLKDLKALVDQNPDIKYLVFQIELVTVPHVQGYVQFVKKKRLRGAKAALPGSPHLQIRKGDHEQAWHYCTKPHDGCQCKHCVAVRLLPNNGRGCDPGPFEYGSPTKGSGQRTDLEAVQRALDEGAPIKTIAEEFFQTFLKYSKGLKEYKLLKRQQERRWITFTKVFYGPPGVGKTRRALEEGGEGAYWLPRPNGPGRPIWWDGYDGQEVVVIDEGDGTWLPRLFMQRLCDRYPLQVETRFGAVPFVARRIYITSNSAPVDWWKGGLGPMERRLTGEFGSITHMLEFSPRDEREGAGPADAPGFPGYAPAPGFIGIVSENSRCDEGQGRVPSVDCGAQSTEDCDSCATTVDVWPNGQQGYISP